LRAVPRARIIAIRSLDGPVEWSQNDDSTASINVEAGQTYTVEFAALAG
jgi:hypothetical protein